MRGLGAEATLPRSQLAARSSGCADGLAGTEASLGQLNVVPETKSTARAGTPSLGSEEEWGRVHLCLFICCLKFLTCWLGADFPLRLEPAQDKPLPCSQLLPGLGKQLVVQYLRNLGYPRST